jgi:uncharacterized membrane protein YraQ (UPF0718 family)
VNATLLLAIATLALVVGPFLEVVARRLPGLAAMLDGATVGGIVVISIFHLLPDAGAHLGWWAFFWLAAGLVLPTVAERLMVKTFRGWKVVIAAAVLGLFLIHEVLESAALVSKANDERVGLATLLVVVGHRLPAGLLLWGHTRRSFGVVGSAVALALVAATIWFVPPLIPVELEFAGLLSALLAGGLLHLVLQHRPMFELPAMRPAAHNAWSAAGLLIAVALLVPYITPHPELEHGGVHAHATFDLGQRFLTLALEVSFPLLLGVLGAGAIEAYLPDFATRWLSRGSRLRQALTGVVFGTPMPVCSCGVLPIYRSLIQRGVPSTAALGFLIAAPEIGVDSIALSWTLLGGETTLARVGAALLLALVVGWVVGGLAASGRARKQPPAQRDPEDHGPHGWRAFRRGLFETWGHLSPWILVGLVVTVLVEPWISTGWSSALAPSAQVAILSLAGLPAYICATAATPFAGVLLAKGFAPGAVIAFLLTGPATNVTTFFALAKLHSRGVALAFVGVAFLTTFGLGLLVNAILDPAAAMEAAQTTGQSHDHGWIEQLSAFALLLLTLWVLFQEGPRSFLAQLWPAEPEAHEGHVHVH